MFSCPLCGVQLHSGTCSCGYDQSRDYVSYPTFSPLPTNRPSSVAQVGYKQVPRKATITCPECGKQTVIYEQKRDYRYRVPSCPSCDKKVMLDPTDRFNINAEVFLLLKTGRKPRGMYACARECMSVFQYGDPEAARRLADELTSVSENPAKHDLELQENLRAAFADYAARAQRMLEEHNVGKCVFDE